MKIGKLFFYIEKKKWKCFNSLFFRVLKVCNDFNGIFNCENEQKLPAIA